MSKLESVSVHSHGATDGLKSQTFVQPLTGVDLLVGPNGAGKTTRGPLAITAAIEGLATVPTDPRRPYVGPLPKGAIVTLTTDTGGVLVRDLGISRGAAVDQANGDARHLVGVPPTAWDLRDFASGTDGDRGAILDAVARAGGALEQWSVDMAMKHTSGLLHLALSEDGDAEAWGAPLADCADAFPTAPDGATWLKAAETWAKKEQRTTNAAQKQAGNHLGELTSAAPEPPEGDEKDDADLRMELLQAEAAANSHQQAVTRAKSAAARHAAEGKRLASALASTAAEGKRLSAQQAAPSTEIPDDVVKRLKEAEYEMGRPVPAYDGADPEALTVEVADAEAALEAARGDASKAESAWAKAAKAKATKATARAKSQAEEMDAAAKLKALNGLTTDATCAHCGEGDPLGIGPKMEAAEKAVSMSAKKATADEHAFVTATLAADAAQTASDKIREKVNAAGLVLSASKNALAIAKNTSGRHADSVEATRKSALTAAKGAFDREKVRIDREADAYAAAEVIRLDGLKAARVRWASTRDARKDWEDSTAPTVPTPPTDDEKASTASELAAVEARLATRTAYAAYIDRVTAASAKFKGASTRWDATRALVKALKQARDDVASAAYAPIAEAARSLLSGASILPQPYFVDPSDYGAEVAGRGRVPYAGLSESEQRITAAALVYALATVAGCPVRIVLLDGLEVVQRDHRSALVSALAQAQLAGHVDSVVLTMAAAPGEDLGEIEGIDGLTVHRIARVSTVAHVQEVVAEVAPTEAGQCPF
ncbi:MAG: hypothetical protein DRQ40_04815 [Gammaproteobacteria bacterium]|nr:MAG: hypothetical protein DRQ40_04815 [Gammaproteobacteria bacterium]